MKKYLIIILILALISCTKKTLNSPLATIVKLESAEAFIDLVEAAKYINKVYDKSTEIGENPYNCWQKQFAFSHNLARNKKFTNHFQCYESEKKEKKQYFNILEKDDINLIVFKKNEIEQKRIIDKNKIDSTVDRLRNSSLKFIKFSSKSKLYFYKNDTLALSIFYNNEYFKCEGKTYSWDK